MPPYTTDDEKDKFQAQMARGIKSMRIQVIGGRPMVVITYADGSVGVEPYDASTGGASGDGAGGSSGGGANGPAWANVNLRGREIEQSAQQFGSRLAEDQRQFNARLGQDSSQFSARQALDEATQRWREAVDKRDFEAAEYWKSRAQELQQNRLAMDYTSLLASKSGPQDWIQYGRLSRQESPLGTPDGKTVPLDQALPSWARGFNPGSYPDSRGNNASGFFGGQGAAAPAPKPAAIGPTWTQAAPGWKQPDGTITAGTPEDLMKNTPSTMQPGYFAGAGGTPIKMSDWMQKQVAPRA